MEILHIFCLFDMFLLFWNYSVFHMKYRVLCVINSDLNVTNRNYFLPCELVSRIKIYSNVHSRTSDHVNKTCKNYGAILRSMVILNWSICIYDNSFFLKCIQSNFTKLIKFNTFNFLPLIQDGSLTSRYPHFCTPSIQYPSSELVNDLFDNSPWGHFYYLHCINMHQENLPSSDIPACRVSPRYQSKW